MQDEERAADGEDPPGDRLGGHDRRKSALKLSNDLQWDMLELSSMLPWIVLQDVGVKGQELDLQEQDPFVSPARWDSKLSEKGACPELPRAFRVPEGVASNDMLKTTAVLLRLLAGTEPGGPEEENGWKRVTRALLYVMWRRNRALDEATRQAVEAAVPGASTQQLRLARSLAGSEWAGLIHSAAAGAAASAAAGRQSAQGTGARASTQYAGAQGAAAATAGARLGSGAGRGQTATRTWQPRWLRGGTGSTWQPKGQQQRPFRGGRGSSGSPGNQ
jgi:hypothetical protein